MYNHDFQSVTYGSGSWSGNEYLDTVSLSPELTIKNQSIGVATTSQGFEGIDGILGCVMRRMPNCGRMAFLL